MSVFNIFIVVDIFDDVDRFPPEPKCYSRDEAEAKSNVRFEELLRYKYHLLDTHKRKQDAALSQ